MSGTNNPFSKFVVDPSSIPDPNKISLQQFERYNSLEMERINSLFRTIKRSGLYIGGVLGLCLVGAWWAEKQARTQLFGSDSTPFSTQTRAAATWTSSLFAMRTTTPTTASSSAPSTSLRGSSRTALPTATST
jgi:hypothetical protein